MNRIVMLILLLPGLACGTPRQAVHDTLIGRGRTTQEAQRVTACLSQAELDLLAREGNPSGGVFGVVLLVFFVFYLIYAACGGSRARKSATHTDHPANCGCRRNPPRECHEIRF